VLYHNYTVFEQVASYPIHRQGRFHNDIAELIKGQLARRTRVGTIRQLVRDRGITTTRSDIYNIRNKLRLKELGGTTVIQWLADTLKDRDFFFRIETADSGNSNRVTRLFFAYP